MESDKDDNDNEQKNIDTYKVLGDQMARLALKGDSNAIEENNYLITYDDLAGKVPNVNPNPILKTTSTETKNKGKVKFSQNIKSSPSSSKIETNKNVNKKSNKNIIKSKSDIRPNDSEKKLPYVNSLINPTLLNSNANILTNSITNANTNSSRDKNNINLNNKTSNISKSNFANNPNNSNPNNTNSINNIVNNNNDSTKTKNINNFNNNKNNNVIVTNINQPNFISKNFSLKPSNKNSNSNTISTIKQNNINKPNQNNIPSRTNNFPNITNTISNSRSNNSNQNNNIDSKNNETINSEDLEPIEIEIVSPEDLEGEESFQSSINPFFLGEKVTKNRHLSLYDREMKNLKKKRTKLDKERKLIIQKKMNYLQPGPVINDASHNMVSKMGEYVPIQERAAQIHSRHLTQIILNEELTRIERQNKEDKEMENIRNNLKIRKYEKEKWDNFVESCLKWQEEVNYKRRAAEIFRNNMDKKVNYKPKINVRSKNIMKKIQKGNNSVDNVFNRLYNDYEEHKERQRILDDENLPPFYPKINNVKYFNKYLNKRKNSSANSSFDRFVTDDRKNNFFLESHIKINGNKLDTYRIHKNKNIKNADKFVNKSKNLVENKNNSGQKNVNKSYRPTQATNNSTILLNTEGNTNGYTNRYLTTENPIFTETNQYYIPTIANNNNFSDDRIEEISKGNYNQNKNNINDNYFADIDEGENIICNNNNNNKNNDFNQNNNFYNNEYNNDKNLNPNINNNIDNEMNINNYSNNKNIYPNNNYIYNEINNNNINNESFQSNNKNQSNKMNNYNRNKKIKNNKKEEYSDNNKKNTKDNLNTKSRNKSSSRNKQKSISKKDSSSKNPKSFETNEINNTEEDKIKKSDINSPKINIYKKTTSDKSNINCCIGTEEMFRDEEILQELNDAKMKTKERLDKENEENYDNEKSEDNLYRINIRDTTPENIKENVVIPSDKYKNFFDIEGIKEL